MWSFRRMFIWSLLGTLKRRNLSFLQKHCHTRLAGNKWQEPRDGVPLVRDKPAQPAER